MVPPVSSSGKCLDNGAESRVEADITRFPIAFQIVSLLGAFIDAKNLFVLRSYVSGLLTVVWFMPESPRWLVKVGRDQEARFILRRLRGKNDGIADAEYQDIKDIVKLEQENSQSTSYFAMLFGIKQGKLHTARRIQLVVWLQILQEWIGIAGITIYGPEIFTISGIAAKDRQWVSGLNNITYVVRISYSHKGPQYSDCSKSATSICVFTLNRIGRRWTLYWGAVGQGICCFCAGGLSLATQQATGSSKTHIGGAAVFFVYLYTAIFGATWLTVPWLYPAELSGIIIHWSLADDRLWVLLLPTIFAALNEKTLYIFGGVNVLSIIVVWAFYPETNQRTLEEMNLVFASDSWFNWEAEKNFARLSPENPGLVHAARAGSLTTGPETGLPSARKIDSERQTSTSAKQA
ncbi:hypothetical protein LTR17_014008 [Elasticomyces elasticus]|nr:hypothetical protein LTR17_014008 [Elasticomyces elasticus]